MYTFLYMYYTLQIQVLKDPNKTKSKQLKKIYASVEAGERYRNISSLFLFLIMPMGRLNKENLMDYEQVISVSMCNVI